MSRGALISRILSGILIFILLSFLSGYIVLKVFTGGRTILVPDVTGKELSVALKMLQGKKLYGIIEREKHHALVPRNYVISQRPAPGAKKKAFATVALTLSTGPAVVKMPDLRHIGVRQAGLEMSQAGAGLQKEIYIHHPLFADGEVIAHIPDTGEPLIPGETITFLVSLGKQPNLFRMPDLIGKTVTEAGGILQQISKPDIVYEDAPEQNPGTIVSQNPAPGEPFSEMQHITLHVARIPGGDKPPSIFTYRVPDGLLDKALKIVYETPEAQERVLETKIVKPGEIIRLFLPHSTPGTGKVKIMLDGILTDSIEW